MKTKTIANTKAERKKLFKYYRNNKIAFGRALNPSAFYADTPPFHHEIMDLLSDPDEKRCGVEAPRSHAKSMMVTKTNTIHEVLHKDPDEILPIVLISESGPQAKDFLYDIKRTLSESRLVRDVYTPLWGHGFSEDYCSNVDELKWTEESIILPNQVKISARGTKQKIRGVNFRDTRPKLIILDDFESEYNCETLEAAQSNRRWVTNAVIPALHDNGKIFIIGNLVSDFCFLTWIRENKGWAHLRYQAIDDGWNEPLWPERFPIEKLKNTLKYDYEEMGNPYGFWREYMNQIIQKMQKQ